MHDILAGYDGSASAQEAVRFAKDLADKEAARLHILTVVRCLTGARWPMSSLRGGCANSDSAVPGSGGLSSGARVRRSTSPPTSSTMLCNSPSHCTLCTTPVTQLDFSARGLKCRSCGRTHT